MLGFTLLFLVGVDIGGWLGCRAVSSALVPVCPPAGRPAGLPACFSSSLALSPATACPRAADSRAACEASPYVESLTSKGYEVLYLTEPIDEVAVQNLQVCRAGRSGVNHLRWVSASGRRVGGAVDEVAAQDVQERPPCLPGGLMALNLLLFRRHIPA